MKLNKIFKLAMVLLLVISVAVLVWGFIVGFETKDGQAVDVLLYWAYAMVGLALVSWVVIGGIVGAKNNKWFILNVAVILVGLAAICFVAYLLAPGAPAVGYNGAPVDSETLKITDTILNLTYFAGGCAILAIIIGEIRIAIANKK